MSAKTDVRNAIVSWLTAANFPNVIQIHRAAPKKIDFANGASAGQITRVALYVHLGRAVDTKIATGGANSGWKEVKYRATIQVLQYSLQADGEVASDDFDTITDAIVARLRTGGHRLGLSDGSVIWQAAVDNITQDLGEPKMLESGATEYWAGIQFDVQQMVQA